MGESLTMIGKLLGHTQVQTTDRYAHLARHSIQNAAARIAGRHRRERLFRLFRVERVPAVAVVPGGVPACRSPGCPDDAAPPFEQRADPGEQRVGGVRRAGGAADADGTDGDREQALPAHVRDRVQVIFLAQKDDERETGGGHGACEGAGEDARAEERGPRSRALSAPRDPEMRRIRVMTATGNTVRQYLTTGPGTPTLQP